MPRVSVIIPNYNHAEYLQQRIDSVLNQTFTDFELIILDDCSTDNSKEIIESYRNQEKVSNIVFNDTNSGSTFKQWEKGIKLAKGEYMWIAESDDWSEPVFLETIMNGLERDNNTVLGYCQSYCINGDKSIQFQSNHPRLEEYLNGKKFIEDYLLVRNPIFNAGMAVWKKNVYTRISKDYLKYKVIGDHCFWFEICSKGDVFISGKLLNYFRTHDKNVSVNAFRNGLLFKEQIPFLKNLLANKTIETKIYRKALKRIYSFFLHHKKTMSGENVRIIKKMFSSASASTVDLKLYFCSYYIKNALKKFKQVKRLFKYA